MRWYITKRRSKAKGSMIQMPIPPKTMLEVAGMYGIPPLPLTLNDTNKIKWATYR